MENHQSPHNDSSPMQGQPSLQPAQNDDLAEKEDISDAVFMGLLDASIKSMNQESEASASSNYSTHNYKGLENMRSCLNSDGETRPKEVVGGTKNIIQLEQNEIPRMHSQDVTCGRKKPPNAGVFKGEIREIGGGNIEWKDGDEWVPAVHHNSIREKLIKQADQLGSYDHRRKHGLDPLDITSFHPDQKTWGPDRDEHWPFMPDQLLFRLERQGYPTPDYDVTYLIDEGRVVLDIENRPVKNYHNIPLTLSSETEAYLMEQINRMDMRITHRDFRARMPHAIETGTGTKPILSLSAIGMRLKRFRLENACPSWTARQKSGPLKPFVKSLLSDEGLRCNSTQELSGLTKLQQEIVQRGSICEFSSSSGAQNPNPISRARRKQADVRRLVRLQAAEKDKIEDLRRGEKRTREEDSSSVFDDESSSSSSRPTKVARLEWEDQSESNLDQASSSEIGNPDDLFLQNASPDHSSQANIHQNGSSSAQTTHPVYNFDMGYDPPPTNPEDDFETQYNDIQRYFNAG